MRVAPENSENCSRWESLERLPGSIFGKLNCVFSLKQRELSSGPRHVCCICLLRCAPDLKQKQFSPRKRAQGCRTRNEKWVHVGRWVRSSPCSVHVQTLPLLLPFSARLCATSKPPTSSRGMLLVPFDKCRLAAQRG